MGAPILHLQTVTEGAPSLFEQPINVHVRGINVIVRSRLSYASAVIDSQGPQANLRNRLGRSIELACRLDRCNALPHPLNDLLLGPAPGFVIDLIDGQAA